MVIWDECMVSKCFKLLQALLREKVWLLSWHCFASSASFPQACVCNFRFGAWAYCNAGFWRDTFWVDVQECGEFLIGQVVYGAQARGRWRRANLSGQAQRPVRLITAECRTRLFDINGCSDKFSCIKKHDGDNLNRLVLRIPVKSVPGVYVEQV